MDSKAYRLRELINPADGHSLVVDASAGLSLGPLPGLEQFAPAVQQVLPLVDGLIASPGKVNNLTGRTRSDAALLVRADWTNALRESDFVLPPEHISHLPLLSPLDALDLGASAMVVYFLLGFEEQIEAGCLRNTVHLALEGTKVGMPLITDVQAIGPRVVLESKAIELGVSYSLEAGADGVAVRWPGEASFRTIIAMASGVPVWIKPSQLPVLDSELQQVLDLGGSGLWLDHQLFAVENFPRLLEAIDGQLHPSQAYE
jgi:DhnA family fructose-bisphosphate aldolase class Ia